MKRIVVSLLLILVTLGANAQQLQWREGGIVRGDRQKPWIALVFTADGWNDGAQPILEALKEANVKGNFFLTGKYYELFPNDIRRMKHEGHYVSTHGYGHLLYLPWDRRDTMLVSRDEFREDMEKAYQLMKRFGIKRKKTRYFIPSYEHYNDTVSQWAKEMGLQVICQTPGPRTPADYITPSMKGYASSAELMEGLMNYEAKHGLNGHMVLIHLGTHPERTDKLYSRLPQIIAGLKARGYQLVSVPKMMESK